MALLDKFRKKTKQSADKRAIKEEPVRDAVTKSVVQQDKKDKKEKKRPIFKPVGKTAVRAYQVIKEVHITEKAAFLIERNQYVFKVFKTANKTEIKKAIEGLYGVKVEKVRIVRSAPKKRRLGRYEGWKEGLKKGFKKAIVTLRQGDKIEIMPR